MRKTTDKTEPFILLVLFVIYIIVLFKITIFRDSYSVSWSVSLAPFSTNLRYLQAILKGNRIAGISNILGNLIMFFPLGYISASLFPKMRKFTKILILSFVFSLGIEIFQYAFSCGSSDIDDVILNTIGGVIGYLIYIFTSRFFKPKSHAVFISALLITITCVCFFAVNSYRLLFALPAPDNLPIRTETLNSDLSEPERTVRSGTDFGKH